MESFPTAEKPLVVLVYQPSFLRIWMERALGKQFRTHVFSSSERATAFIGAAKRLDVLVTDLELGLATLGGCNIARDAIQRFPESQIFIFSDAPASDHRLLILKGIGKVKYLSKPLGAFLLARHLRRALEGKEK